MCLSDKEFAIEFLMVNLISLLSTLWGEIFVVKNKLNHKNKFQKTFLTIKYVE